MGRSQKPDKSKQARAIAALLTEKTIKDAAEAASVGRTTLFRWMKEDEEFKAELRRAQKDLFQHTLARVQSLSSSAADTLAAIMEDSSEQAPARVSAAKALLSFAFQSNDHADLEAMVAELERNQQELEQKLQELGDRRDVTRRP